jgi:hypothetical protein
VIFSERGNGGLYRIIIARELTAINKSFHIFGLINENIEKFEQSVKYELFIIKSR